MDKLTITVEFAMRPSERGQADIQRAVKTFLEDIEYLSPQNLKVTLVRADTRPPAEPMP